MINNLNSNNNPFSEWISRDKVKEFFGYKNTTMASFARDNGIRYTRVGDKTFYRTEDIRNLLANNEGKDDY